MNVRHTFLLTALLIPTLHAEVKPQSFTVDERTTFLLAVDEKTGALLDLAGKVKPLAADGSFVQDTVAGACLQLGAENTNGIVIRDDGAFDFSRGMTIDAWIKLDAPPVKPAAFALKVGSFAWSLDTGKLSAVWQVFPRADIFTTAPEQYNYYTFGMEAMNGLLDVPVRQWTRLTISYDTALGAVTTLVDGVVDRRRYRAGGAEPLQCESKSSLTLFSGLKGCRVASVKLSIGTPEVVPPSIEAWLNALPYRGQAMITLDYIDRRLPLPIDVTIVTEKASGSANTLQRVTLDSHTRRDLVFDLPTWTNSIHSFHISAAAGGRQCFSRTLRMSNVKPAGRTLLHEDHTLSRDGRKFFPLMVYHAMPDDYPLLAELGFNMLHNDFNLSQAHGHRGAARDQALLECLDAAEKNHLFILPSTNSAFGNLGAIQLAKNHSALLMWYHADEPWGDIARLHDSYNTIKMLEPDLPLLIVQNNASRLQDTAVAADILAMDPYPIPNVSLRSVADATKACIRAVADRKPVWTVLPQYATKIPTREELRCMVWLALASGANGLGIYAWDDRIRDLKTKEYKGWHTREHSEQIENLRVVLSEIRANESILLAAKAAQQPVPMTNPALHALIRETNGKRWLIVANDSRRAEESSLDLGVAGITKANRLIEGGIGLSFTNGKTTLKLPPLGAALYELE